MRNNKYNLTYAVMYSPILEENFYIKYYIKNIREKNPNLATGRC